MPSDRTQAFRASVAERIVQMNVTWIQLEQGVGDRDIGDGLLRELHTLKGEASLLGFTAIADLAHALEGIVAAVIEAGRPPSIETGDQVLRVFDLITNLSERRPDEPAPEVARFLASLEASIAPATPMPSTMAAVQHEPAAQQDAPATQADTHHGAHRPGAAETTLPSGIPAGESSEISLSALADKARALASYSVKVNPRQLDRMRDIIGELLLARTRLARFAAALHRERKQGNLDSSTTEPEIPYEEEESEAPHEDILRSIEGQLRDDVVRLATLINALDDITRDLRMVSVSVLFDRYPLAVRKISRDLGREVQLARRGDTVQADRDVLEAIEDSLLHLVRNAVDHGIEPPDERRRMGKPAVGTVTLDASVLGDTLCVKVSDDGAGIDIERVRRQAIERNVVDAASARLASAHQVLQWLFVSGMTTRSSISHISGRGIGLDIVQKTARNLGGSVELSSQPGKGTTFLLSVPIRASISSVLLFRVGRGNYALPTSTLVAIEELDDYPLAASIDGPALRYKDGMLVPLVAMEPLLGEPRHDSRQGRRRSRVIIAQQGAVTVGLTGSYRHLQREAVLKSASHLFRDNGLITAGLALEDGSIALVINPGEMYRIAHNKQARDLGMARQIPEPPSPDRKHTVLVAEDSPIVRDLVVEALRVHGLHVIEAADGQEALEQLAAHPEIQLLVTDVEMPRLDGLGLIKTMRTRGGRRIPAIVVSTRGSDADKMAAVAVGADAYLVKSEFSREGLWSLVARFLA